MGREKAAGTKKPPVTFASLPSPHGATGLFGLEDEAAEVARQAKLQRLAERLGAYERGYEGSRRRCPRCGQGQQYKGERARQIEVDGGRLTRQRAYSVCPGCGQTRYPLDEQLGLVEGKEQGRLREKFALVAVLSPYPQAPAVCQTLLGKERDGITVRRVALREAKQLTASGHQQPLPTHDQDRLDLEGDGHLCPTRELRRTPDDQG